MKKRIFTIVMIITALIPPVCASKLGDLLRTQLRMEVIQGRLLNTQGESLIVQRDILSTQREIDSLIKLVNQHMAGHSGWGTYQFHDYQAYGSSANDWTSLMRMAEIGQGEGALGQVLHHISNQFRINQNEFNRGVSDTRSQQYYAVKSQTVLATRAASQFDYNNIYEQIRYQQMLQQQIERTNDIKAALDLNNRLQVEGNLIQLALLREIALSNQQQAITEQASVNAALSNAKFLSRN